MTIGMRIAHKRKELGLSQEGLGEQLGVSRQAIYKWESDSALPEIEKLITLSRIFSVSVGWLLGVEEEASAPAGEGELTETQMKMVEEIVGRYLAARPAPEPAVLPKRRRWPFVLAALVLVIVFVSLFTRLSEMKNQYDNLQYSINNVTGQVNSQISSIASRVEEVLKSQNELTAEYGVGVRGADLAENTVTFALHATPKSHTEGMTAYFIAENGVDTVTVPAVPGGENSLSFSGEVTCAITDAITLKAVFVTGDLRESQVLEVYSGLYSGSFPGAYTVWPLWFDVSESGNEAVLEAGRNTVHWLEPGKDFGNGQQAVPETVRVGLFKDKKLLMWYTEAVCDVTDTESGAVRQEKEYERGELITLDRGSVYVEAVVVTDQFGRTRVYPDTPIAYDEVRGSWQQFGSYEMSSEPEDWAF